MNAVFDTDAATADDQSGDEYGLPKFIPGPWWSGMDYQGPNRWLGLLAWRDYQAAKALREAA